MNLFKAPKIHTPPPPAVVAGPTQIKVPTQDDPRVKAAGRQKARDDEKERKGRTSTNFAAGRGGPVYSRSRLG